MTTVSKPGAEADAVPQCVGLLQPHGSIIYICAGRGDHGLHGRCSNMLFAWIPPEPDETGKQEHGRIEAKCRRCRTLNVIVLDASLVR